jgi:hypothetical protein
MFVAIALGIQAGFALKGDGSFELTPENLPNRSKMELGDAFPPLPVVDLEGNQLLLGDITDGKTTIIGVVMPGCDPCKTLLGEWQTKGITSGGNDFQVILLATSAKDTRELGPLEEFAKVYPVYFCDNLALKEHCGLSTFPSIVGLGADNTVSFVANGYVHRLDVDFFNEFL